MLLHPDELSRPRRIHLVGIGGVGVSAVARALHALGHQVTGSDRRGSSITAALQREGIAVGLGTDGARVTGTELVGRSGAVRDSDPEIAAARAARIPVLHRAALLGAIAGVRSPSIGVMGTHGKGTVAAMLTRILDEDGRRPSFVIGAQLCDFEGRNSRITTDGPLIAEVDESDGSHALVPVEAVVINNLEADHLNYYSGIEAIRDSVRDALERSARLRQVFFNAGCASARAAVPANVPAISFALDATADVTGTSVGIDRLELRVEGRALATVKLRVAGRHNLANAVAAAAVATTMGCSSAAIGRGLSDYSGLVNRMTVVERGPTRIVKDFVSHATGIRAVLEAIADDPRPIIAVFRPFRYTLVRYLGDEYARAFQRASRIVITDLDVADETPIPGGSADDLATRLEQRGAVVERVPFAALRARIAALIGQPVQIAAFGGDDLFAEVAAAEVGDS